MVRHSLHFATRHSPFAILLLVCVGPATGATYDVGAAETYTTITDAIAAADDGTGDIINVVDPNHTEPNIVVNKSLTIQGQGMDTTIVQAHADVNLASSRVFTVEASKTVTIKDMTIQHGRVVGGLLLVAEQAMGGGIKNSGALTLRNVRVTANRAFVNALTGPTPGFAARGGGIYNDGTMAVVDCEITNNDADGEPSQGGGIYSSVDISILRTLISGNSAHLGYMDCQGGGVYNQGELTVTDSTLSSNTAYGRDSVGLSPHDAPGYGWGGAIYNTGLAEVTNSTLQSNTARGGHGAEQRAGDAFGGGIYNGGELTVVDSALDDNEAMGGNGTDIPLQDAQPGNAYGGGIANQADANVAVLRSTLSNNSVVEGIGDSGETGMSRGGGASDSGAVSSAEIMTFTNSTISGNSADEGGGIFGYRGISLTSCTVAGNSAASGGGLNSGTDANDTGPVLANTIVGDNAATTSGPDINGTVQSRGYNLIEDPNSGTIDDTGGGNTAVGNITGQDPLLGPLADNGGSTKTHALLTGSPALDQIPVGTNGMGTAPLDVDQRAVARPQRSLGDMGAFEFSVADEPSSGCCSCAAAPALPFLGLALLMLGRFRRRPD